MESGAGFFGRDRRGVVNDYLHFNARDDIYEYGVVFEKGLRSAIDSNNLIDMLDESLSLLGNTVYVVAATVDTGARKLTLKLIDTLLVDILAEGQDRPYAVTGKTYDVKVVVVDVNAQVKFRVNGYETKPLRRGEIVVLPDKTILGVAEVLLNEAGEGPDLVKFYIGTNFLEATDKYSDSEFSYDVQSSREPLHTAKVQFIASTDGNTLTLSEMKFRLEASSKQGDVYVPAGGSLREQLLEPDAMFPGNWDMVYDGFGIGGAKQDGRVPLEFSPTGDGFQLHFTNRQGVKYTIPLLSARGQFMFGDERRVLWFIEAPDATTYPIARGDLFMTVSQRGEQGVTNVLSYEGIDTASKRIFFQDRAVGQKEVPYESTGSAGQEGVAQLTMAGQTHTVYIGMGSGNPIAVDLDGDGAMGGKADIVFSGGGLLNLGSTNDISSAMSVTTRLIVPARLLKEATADESTDIVFTRSGSSVDIDVPNAGDLQLVAAPDRDLLLGQTKYGTLFQINRRKTTGQLFVDFPQKQALGSVTIKVQGRITR